VKFEKLKPEMIVYDVGRTRMGNTTMTTVSVRAVKIISVDAESRTVVASWNTNPPRTYSGNAISKWRAKLPVLVRSVFGRARLATRGEAKQARELASRQIKG